MNIGLRIEGDLESLVFGLVLACLSRHDVAEARAWLERLDRYDEIRPEFLGEVAAFLRDYDPEGPLMPRIRDAQAIVVRYDLTPPRVGLLMGSDGSAAA